MQPILNYAATVWSPHTKVYINKLQIVQNRAVHFICKDYRRLSSVTRMLNSLDMKPISYVHTKLRLLLLYKILHKLVELPLPSYVMNYIKSGTQGNEHKFNLPHFTVDCYKFSFHSDQQLIFYLFIMHRTSNMSVCVHVKVIQFCSKLI